jgi:hypothetical protein
MKLLIISSEFGTKTKRATEIVALLLKIKKIGGDEGDRTPNFISKRLI